MIVKFFRRGKGGGASPINYLLGEDMKREGARVLSGNPFLTKELIDSTNYKRRYTSGVISFEEEPSYITEKQKHDIIDKFEKTLLAGLDHQQYNILWVEHTDKGRLELNFLIPNMELISGKRLQPYYYVADEYRVNAFQNIINHDYKLTNPHALAKRRLHDLYTTSFDAVNKAPSPFNPKPLTKIDNKKELGDEINKRLRKMIDDAGDNKAMQIIRRRADVIEWLEEQGLTVIRNKTRKKEIRDEFLSISSPHPDIKMNVRLKGAMYEKSFEINRYKLDLQPHREDDISEDEMLYSQSVSTWNEGFEQKSAYHAKRFNTLAPAPITITRELQKELEQYENTAQVVDNEISQTAKEVRRFRL
ncbi:relaxase/mobilization nuclease domain-containing protein [Psychrobacter alimentarius]|uniref:relaxase/mobilization nuclease domain-containing protein n=1 Tax=Psychrobacter alimentarius TaxID=261164 RepID=UPI003FCEFF5E